MAEDEAKLIEKITSHEADLASIYREVYPVLKSTDRAGLPEDVVADLESLDPPETIEPSKTAAILKSIRGSTSEDKFQFERFFGASMPNGQSLGDFVRAEMTKIDIEYHDFWPYLRVRGWLR